MKKFRDVLRELEDVLMVAFKVLSLGMAISVVFLVEALGIWKVWAMVARQ